MVPAPKRVDSVSFENTTGDKLTVKVHYDDHKDKKEIVVEAAVEPHATHLFAAQELDMGGWQAVAPVTKVVVGSGTTLTPNVSGVVKVLKVTAAGAGNGIKLSQSEH